MSKMVKDDDDGGVASNGFQRDKTGVRKFRGKVVAYANKGCKGGRLSIL
jgi:hypothetical protein